MTEYFENILDALLDGLPKDWDKVILQAIYGEATYDIKYYVSAGNIKNIDCFDLGIKYDELKRIFKNVNEAITPMRSEMKEKSGLWMTMTLIIDRQGHVKSDFGYDDVNEDLLEYRKKWKKKYLT